MADNVAITAGSGVNVATDERTIASVAVQVQRVTDHAPPSAGNGQVVPTATAATLIAARDTRHKLVFVNATNMVVYIGVATVTSSNGVPLQPGAAMDWDSGSLVQLIVATVTGLTGFVAYADFYD